MLSCITCFHSGTCPNSLQIEGCSIFTSGSISFSSFPSSNSLTSKSTLIAWFPFSSSNPSTTSNLSCTDLAMNCSMFPSQGVTYISYHSTQFTDTKECEDLISTKAMTWTPSNKQEVCMP